MTSASKNIKDQVFRTLSTYLRMDPSRLQFDDSLRDDLGLDSLQTIELVYEVESAFDLQIPDEDFGRMKTVGDVVTYLHERTSLQKAPSSNRPHNTSSKAAPHSPRTRSSKKRTS